MEIHGGILSHLLVDAQSFNHFAMILSFNLFAMILRACVTEVRSNPNLDALI